MQLIAFEYFRIYNERSEVFINSFQNEKLGKYHLMVPLEKIEKTNDCDMETKYNVEAFFVYP